MQASNAGVVLVFVLAVATAWLGWRRFSMPAESNWPLVYYAALAALTHSLPGLLHLEVLYVAVAAALLLRFEIMNRAFSNCIRVVEALCFGLIGWRLALRVWTGFS